MKYLIYTMLSLVFLCGGNPLQSEPYPVKRAIKGSGLPIPRFVMTKSAKVNLRVGPGNQYPARITYIRKGVPLKVIAEFDFWRKVQDMDGQEGWIHKSLLCNTRIVWVKTDSVLISDPLHPETLLLKALKGVEGEFLNHIKGDYAKVRIADHKGWMKIQHLWGIIQEPTTN